jgi:uncharacterized protein YjeT (DUF2065 family)
MSHNWRSFKFKLASTASKVRSISVILALVLIFQGMLPFVRPAIAAPRQAGNRQTSENLVEEAIAPILKADGTADLDPADREMIAQHAQEVANALILNDDGTAGIRQEVLSNLKRKQREMLTRMVDDINKGNVGLALVNADGSTKLWGNTKALESSQSSSAIHPDNATWIDWHGLHIYIDGFWTWQLEELQGWAISTVVGLIAGALCGTGVGCIAVGVVVSFVWDQIIWHFLRAYWPTSFQINAPWWGWVTLQAWSTNRWLNGYTIRTWLWT